MQPYLDYLITFVRTHTKQIAIAIGGLLLLREARALLLIAVFLGGIYLLAPEVRPYWSNAWQNFVSGVFALLG